MKFMLCIANEEGDKQKGISERAGNMCEEKCVVIINNVLRDKMLCLFLYTVLP